MRFPIVVGVLFLALLPVASACGGQSETNKHDSAGVKLQTQGDFLGAIEEFNEAIRLDPGNSNAYTNRGFAYNQLGMYQRAIEDLDDAIRLDPDRAEAYNNRAFSYYNV